MSSVNSSIKNFSHSVGQNCYHLVLTPKMRYPLFSQKHQRDLADKAFEWVAGRHKIDIFAKEIMDDHVHLFVSCPPNCSVRKLAQLIKGGSSYYMRKYHPPLRQYRALWSKGFMYRSVGSVSAEVVQHYIENSNDWFASKQQKKLI